MNEKSYRRIFFEIRIKAVHIDLADEIEVQILWVRGNLYFLIFLSKSNYRSEVN